MTKLTDTQLIVLSSATKHESGLATRPINLHAAAAMKVASSLIDKGLVREIRAKGDAPFWREDDDGRFALKITKAGREAIGVEDANGQDAAPVARPSAASEPKKPSSKRAAEKGASKTPAPRTPPTPAGAAVSADGNLVGQLRPGSKQAIVVGLMMRPAGGTLDELIAATDWLPHTTRAALTGLRKRGYSIERTRGEDKITRYRATPPEAAASDAKHRLSSAPAEAPVAQAA